MKAVALIKNILVVLLTFVVLVSNLSSFFVLRPPASVVTVPFRMILQITLKIQAIGLPILILSYLTYHVLSGKNRPVNKISAGCIAVLVVCAILSILSWIRITHATAQKSNLTYDSVNAGSGRDSYELKLVRDISEELGVSQCSIYQDQASPYQSTCIVYMNYGGWSVQDASMGQQIFSFCEKEGYTFIRFADARTSDEKIDTVIETAGQDLNQLFRLEKYDHVLLCGGSAGGHIALLCAAWLNQNIDTSADSTKADGVAAFYPCIDPGYCYDYYVISEPRKKSILDHLGDWIYCKLYGGTTKTLAGETQKLDEEVFGAREDEESYYESYAISNSVDSLDIPILIVQGGADSMMPKQPAKELYTKLEAMGRSIVYLELPGVEHVFDMMPTAAWDRCEKEMTGFVRKICEDGQ